MKNKQEQHDLEARLRELHPELEPKLIRLEAELLTHGYRFLPQLGYDGYFGGRTVTYTSAHDASADKVSLQEWKQLDRSVLYPEPISDEYLDTGCLILRHYGRAVVDNANNSISLAPSDLTDTEGRHVYDEYLGGTLDLPGYSWLGVLRNLPQTHPNYPWCYLGEEDVTGILEVLSPFSGWSVWGCYFQRANYNDVQAAQGKTLKEKALNHFEGGLVDNYNTAPEDVEVLALSVYFKGITLVGILDLHRINPRNRPERIVKWVTELIENSSGLFDPTEALACDFFSREEHVGVCPMDIVDEYLERADPTKPTLTKANW